MNGMTGYSFKEYIIDDAHITTEIKTVNSRFLDMNINLPFYLNSMEIDIRNLLKDRIKRGKVDVNVNVKVNEKKYNVNANVDLAKIYADNLRSIIDHLNLKDDVKLFHLTRFEDVIKVEKQRDYSKYWKHVSKSLHENLDDVLKMRIKEGKDIKKDLLIIIKRIKKNVNTIEKKLPKMEKAIFNNIKDKVLELVGNNVDEVRLLNETAFLVNRSCINEEVKRLISHIEQFLSIIKDEEWIGKKLDFLCQEMHREINTIGSKITLVELTSNVIAVKNDIEKMREQIRNIE